MSTSLRKRALILGAGPAGLTAALELLRHTDIQPVIIERSANCGGMGRSYPLGSGTVDVGGHRFHTASARVRDFWLSVMPVSDTGFRIKRRRSLLFFEDHYFSYPVKLTLNSIGKLGLLRSLRIGLSLLTTEKRPVESLEDFFRCTYGDELFKVFFERYTQKIWGRASRDIPADWGGERLKRPSIKASESTFFYPKRGPGFFWESVSREILQRGGEIRTSTSVEGIKGTNVRTDRGVIQGDFVLSTLPLARLCQMLAPRQNFVLPFRSLVSVNLVLKRSRVRAPQAQWIYINDERVQVARLQLYRHWDESMVSAPDEEILGLEYIVSTSDALWLASDEKLVAQAVAELSRMGIYDGEIGAKIVLRYEEAYPCYWGDYAQLHELQALVDRHPRVFSFGRQGLHRYINMDQAMMSALRVVDHIRSERDDRKSLWSDFSDLHLPE